MSGSLRYQFTNINQFVDNLFPPNTELRDPMRLVPKARAIADTDAEADGVAAVWVAEPPDVEMMLAAMLNGFLHHGSAESSCPESDRRFLGFLGEYLQRNAMTLWVPRLTQQGTFANTAKGKTYQAPRYRVNTWRQYHLSSTATGSWIIENVRRLIKLFAAGAHFIVLHEQGDTGVASENFYTEFGKTFGAYWFNPIGAFLNTAIGHSHYRHHGSGGPVPSLFTAYGYPKITGERAPSRCPFICSLIVDTTAWKTQLDIDRLLESGESEPYYNSFFQLEGWPGTYVSGRLGLSGRHGADFATHQATIWNISTFGMCPYSEKRGTPIILAPRGYHLQPGPMKMPAFSGADSVQTWFNRNSVTADVPQVERAAGG